MGNRICREDYVNKKGQLHSISMTEEGKEEKEGNDMLYRAAREKEGRGKGGLTSTASLAESRGGGTE